ncbi:hypothetical protein SCA6_009644, partial [Theobroma cacao]
MESFSLAPMENFSCKSPDFKGHMRVGTTLIWLLSLLNSVEYGTEQGPVVVVEVYAEDWMKSRITLISLGLE